METEPQPTVNDKSYLIYFNFLSLLISGLALLIAFNAPKDNAKNEEYLSTIIEANQIIEERVQDICNYTGDELLVQMSKTATALSSNQGVKVTTSPYNAEEILKSKALRNEKMIDKYREILFKLHVFDDTPNKTLTKTYLSVVGYNEDKTIQDQINDAILFKKMAIDAFGGNPTQTDLLFLGNLAIKPLEDKTEWGGVPISNNRRDISYNVVLLSEKRICEYKSFRINLQQTAKVRVLQTETLAKDKKL